MNPSRALESASRRVVLRYFALGGAVVLAACAGPPAPPPRLLQLPLAPPGPLLPGAGAASAGPTLELARDLALPAELDREAVVLAQDDLNLRLLPGHRWAEPLRDALPRLLRQDLGLLMGDARVWLAPAPWPVQRRLQVELNRLHWRADRRAVLLQARWYVVGTAAYVDAAEIVGSTELEASGGGSSDAEAVVRAHRAAMWQLAQRIAASLR
jgi:uncharacterized lipoprotein YmbA